MEPLDERSFLEYAAKNYDNAQRLDEDEFAEDLKRFKYLKKILSRYELTGDIRHRLVLNHLIVLYNVFGAEALPRMLMFKMGNFMPQLKPFLIVMSVLPPVIEAIGKENRDYVTDDIQMDPHVVDLLRKDGVK
jgi:hypothetical protein